MSAGRTSFSVGTAQAWAHLGSTWPDVYEAEAAFRLGDTQYVGDIAFLPQARAWHLRLTCDSGVFRCLGGKAKLEHVLAACVRWPPTRYANGPVVRPGLRLELVLGPGTVTVLGKRHGAVALWPIAELPPNVLLPNA